MNIVIAANEACFVMTMNMLYTLKKSNPGADIHIWYLNCDEMTAKSLDAVKEYCRRAFWEFTDVPVETKYIQEICRRFTNRDFLRDGLVTPSNMSRILIPYILPVKKCLWIDTDAIILKPVDDLYNIDPGGNCIGASTPIIPKNNRDSYYVRLMGENRVRADNYTSNGVILYNIPQCKEIPLQTIETVLKQSGKYMQMYDQDLYNIIYNGKKHIFPIKYNFHIFQTDDGRILLHDNLDANNLSGLVEDQVILHVCGEIKAHDPRFIHRWIADKYLPKQGEW